MAVRDAGPEPLAFASPAAQPGHVGRRPGLVDEDELFGIEIELSLEPRFPSPQNIRALLLGRVGGLFLNVRPRASKKGQRVVVPVEMPRSARSCACISASVMSSFAATRPSRNASCSSSFEPFG